MRRISCLCLPLGAQTAPSVTQGSHPVRIPRKSATVSTYSSTPPRGRQLLLQSCCRDPEKPLFFAISWMILVFWCFPRNDQMFGIQGKAGTEPGGAVGGAAAGAGSVEEGGRWTRELRKTGLGICEKKKKKEKKKKVKGVCWCWSHRPNETCRWSSTNHSTLDVIQQGARQGG